MLYPRESLCQNIVNSDLPLESLALLFKPADFCLVFLSDMSYVLIDFDSMML